MRASSASCRHRCPTTLNNQTKQRNAFVALVNLNDALLVENNPMDIRDVKAAAKDFFIASGDGVVTLQAEDGRTQPGRVDDLRRVGKEPSLPEREWVRKADVEAMVEYQQHGRAGRRSATLPAKKAEPLVDKLTTIELLGGDYAAACVSGHFAANRQEHVVRDTYMQVQNEFTSAVNELRTSWHSRSLA